MTKRKRWTELPAISGVNKKLCVCGCSTLVSRASYYRHLEALQERVRQGSERAASPSRGSTLQLSDSPGDDPAVESFPSSGIRREGPPTCAQDCRCQLCVERRHASRVNLHFTEEGVPAGEIDADLEALSVSSDEWHAEGDLLSDEPQDEQQRSQLQDIMQLVTSFSQQSADNEPSTAGQQGSEEPSTGQTQPGQSGLSGGTPHLHAHGQHPQQEKDPYGVFSHSANSDCKFKHYLHLLVTQQPYPPLL